MARAERARDIVEHWLTSVSIPAEIRFETIDEVVVSGWAGDPVRSRSLLPKKLFVYHGSQKIKEVAIKRTRQDVADHFDDRRLRKSGFEFKLKHAEIPTGCFTCSVVLEDDSEFWLQPEPTLDERKSRLKINIDYVPNGFGTYALGCVDSMKLGRPKVAQKGDRATRTYHALVETVVNQRNTDFLSVASTLPDQRLVIHLLSNFVHLFPELTWVEMKALAAIQDSVERLKLVAILNSNDKKTRTVALSISRMEKREFSKLVEASSVEVALPTLWDRPRDVSQTTLHVPELGIYRLADVRVVRGSTVVSDREIFLYDLGADSQYEFAAGTWNHLFTHSENPELAIVSFDSREPVTLNSAIMLTGRSASNYFHSLIEYLPRLFLVLRDPKLRDVPLLITDDWPATLQEALQHLCAGREVIKISREMNFVVNELFIPSMHTCIFDSTRRPWIYGSRFSPELLTELRNQLWDWSRPFQSQGARIFLLRQRGARALENAAEIERIAAESGLRLVAPEDLTLQEQIGMFASATHIVGIGGAAFANTVFCSPGTKILSLVAQQLRDFVIHAAIAGHSGSQMSLVLGRTSSAAKNFTYRREYLHAPFHVSPREFRRALKSILQ
jgi:capsular polysaccharide biosynthesis protein